MPIYEYGGQQYDISTDDPAVAKSKILAHLEKNTTTDEGATKAFFRGARSMVQGAGHTAGLVSDEDYSRTYQKGKPIYQHIDNLMNRLGI